MKNKMIFVVLVIFTILPISNNMYSKRKINNEIICLTDIVNNYFYSHYCYPESVEELIEFTEYCLKIDENFFSIPYSDFIRLYLLPKLKQEGVRIKKENYNFILLKKQNILFCLNKQGTYFSPCDISLFIGKPPKEYHSFLEKYSKPRFFNRKELAILSVRLDSIFHLGVLELQKKYIKSSTVTLPYNTYAYENDTIPIYTFWEYRLGDKIHYYCDNKKSPNGNFYNDLTLFCDLFCLENNLSRIVFMLPDYIAFC